MATLKKLSYMLRNKDVKYLDPSTSGWSRKSIKNEMENECTQLIFLSI